jgi:hypothetical protein
MAPGFNRFPVMNAGMVPSPGLLFGMPPNGAALMGRYPYANALNGFYPSAGYAAGYYNTTPAYHAASFPAAGYGTPAVAAAAPRLDSMEGSAGSDPATPAVSSEAATSPQQAAIARAFQELSARRPVRSATVARVQDGAIGVRYQEGAQVRAAVYPPQEVFFFRAGGQLANAAAMPGQLKPGDPVLVPEPQKPPAATASALRR